MNDDKPITLELHVRTREGRVVADEVLLDADIDVETFRKVATTGVDLLIDTLKERDLL